MANPADLEKGKGLNMLTIWELRDVYEMHYGWPKKLAAEVAFALAVAIRRAAESMGPGFRDKTREYLVTASGYAKECVGFLSGLPSETFEDVSTSYTVLADVAIPEKFYLAYVKDSGRFPEFVGLLS